MVDLDCKLPSSNKSPRFSNKLHISIPPPKPRRSELESASDSACSSYEAYLHLPELRKLWTETKFPDWKTEAAVRPALTGLEISFRFISTVLSDPRPYSNKREWTRRLEDLVAGEVEIIAMLLEADEEEEARGGRIPTVDLTSAPGALSRENSSAEVWKSSDYGDDRVVVSHVSAESLLPRLATWTTKHDDDDVWRRIQYQIECKMMRCRSCTLGVGEPNLAGKPSLDYDALCRPSSVHALTKKRSTRGDGLKNYEDQTLYATHQILESWIRVAKHLLERIGDEAARGLHRRAAADCWLLEKVWSLLSKIENLHLLMDPDDFLRLKNQLMLKTSPPELFCFRSRRLVEVTRWSKDLKHMVPEILGVEVDPTGGPRIQDSAMELYRRKEGFEKIHLLQAMQGVEAALKRFYFGYKQVLSAVLGSLEVKSGGTADLLSDIIAEPTYFPSLDGAKTFLGEWWSQP